MPNLKPMMTPAEKRIRSGQKTVGGDAPPFQRVVNEVNRAADKYKKRGK